MPSLGFKSARLRVNHWKNPVLPKLRKIIKFARKHFKESKASSLALLAPIISNRKGHHKPIVNWAQEKGFEVVRCDGQYHSTRDSKALIAIGYMILKLLSAPGRKHHRLHISNPVSNLP